MSGKEKDLNEVLFQIFLLIFHFSPAFCLELIFQLYKINELQKDIGNITYLLHLGVYYMSISILRFMRKIGIN